MSLKAGRVGVAPDQVDGFGKIKSEATSGYTKQEADAKFETKAAAASALAEKQPITLAVPIEMVDGSKLTVEDALQGLNDLTKNKISNKTFTIVENVDVTIKLIKYLNSLVAVEFNESAAITGLPSSWTDMGEVLDEGFVPSSNKTTSIRLDGGSILVLSFNTNGHLYLYCTSAGSVYLKGNCIYLI